MTALAQWDWSVIKGINSKLQHCLWKITLRSGNRLDHHTNERGLLSLSGGGGGAKITHLRQLKKKKRQSKSLTNTVVYNQLLLNMSSSTTLEYLPTPPTKKTSPHSDGGSRQLWLLVDNMEEMNPSGKGKDGRLSTAEDPVKPLKTGEAEQPFGKRKTMDLHFTQDSEQKPPPHFLFFCIRLQRSKMQLSKKVTK